MDCGTKLSFKHKTNNTKRVEKQSQSTFEDVGHSFLGFSGQNKTEVGDELRGSEVNNQPSQTLTAQSQI